MAIEKMNAMKYIFSETRRLWRPSKLIKTRLTGRDLLKILVADMKRKKISTRPAAYKMIPPIRVQMGTD